MICNSTTKAELNSSQIGISKHRFGLMIKMQKLFLGLLLIGFELNAQKIEPKREFRAVWVATVNNIDWPSRAGLSPDIQRTEFVNLLDTYQKLGFNAVIVQVRPSCDAFYSSPYEPWSQWLSGKQGQAPAPYYDPLEFMVAQAHKRQMEFHAWINPLRVITYSKFWEPDKKHLSFTKPGWILTYGNLKILDPGLPAVRQYVAKIVGDIVRRYSVDAIHFDDYFYPYPDGESVLNDDASFKAHRGRFIKKSEWRLENMNLLIKEVSDSIKKNKPYVKFGVSPYSTWRNLSASPLGSATNSGYSCYDHLFADVRKWLQMGWIDYVTPQLYQHSKHRNSPFTILAQWWARNSFGKHLYLGLASYRYLVDEGAWRDRKELPQQIRFSRTLSQVQGIAFYSSKSVVSNQGAIADSLKRSLFANLALVPQMKWLDSIPPPQPQQLNVMINRGSIELTWQKGQTQNPLQDSARYFGIYRFERNRRRIFENPRNLVALTQHQDFRDEFTADTSHFEYYVTAFDKLHNESAPCGVMTTPTLIAQNKEFEIQQDKIAAKEAEYFYKLMRQNMRNYFRLQN
jgi:uncharacterized lipoprotein YddW (UPF0748 family)